MPDNPIKNNLKIAVTSVVWDWHVWLSIITSFILPMLLGAFIGCIVIKTNLPSFIVSLAFLYILRGLTIFGSIHSTQKTIIGGINEVSKGDWLAPLLGGKIFTGLFTWFAEQRWIDVFKFVTKASQPIVDGIPMMIVWAVVFVIFASERRCPGS